MPLTCYSISLEFENVSLEVEIIAGYLAHGTATDYMHDILGVPFSFTWEIYGDAAADFHDCFRMFNPLTSDLLEEASNSSLDVFSAERRLRLSYLCEL